jgi:hypothetical protein
MIVKSSELPKVEKTSPPYAGWTVKVSSGVLNILYNTIPTEF